MDREKNSIQQLLCTADRNGAVHGRKLAGAYDASTALPWIEMDNTDRAYLPTVGRWGCEWPRGTDTGLTGTYEEQCFDKQDAGFELDLVFNNNNNNIYAEFPLFKYDELEELVQTTQVRGAWPNDHPLPLPRWAPQPKEVLKIPDVWQYEELVSQIELRVQKLLEEHNYNTIGNFLDLYRSFKSSGYFNLTDFFHNYNPEITPQHHTCVGLALELWKKLFKLDEKYPGLTNYLYLVSCEENIETVDNYNVLSDHLDDVAKSLEKEHVLLALRFELEGRTGVLLCDPGYHVARVVTVMSDKIYPHTGWFVQSREGKSQKEYKYTFSSENDKFVEWVEHNTNANGIQSSTTGLIYVLRPYLTALDVTERRNLVYSFRSLLSRDQKGQVLAGIYFKIKETNDEFTIFYQDRGVKKRLKLNFAMFLRQDTIDDSVVKVVNECSLQLHLEENALLSILMALAEVYRNQSYIKQLLEINRQINNMGDED